MSGNLENQRAKRTENENTEGHIQRTWDNDRRCNTHIMGVPGRGEEGTEGILEMITNENLSKLMSDAKPQVWDAQSTEQGKRWNTAPKQVI